MALMVPDLRAPLQHHAPWSGESARPAAAVRNAGSRRAPRASGWPWAAATVTPCSLSRYAPMRVTARSRATAEGIHGATHRLRRAEQKLVVVAAGNEVGQRRVALVQRPPCRLPTAVRHLPRCGPRRLIPRRCAPGRRRGRRRCRWRKSRDPDERRTQARAGALAGGSARRAQPGHPPRARARPPCTAYASPAWHRRRSQRRRCRRPRRAPERVRQALPLPPNRRPSARAPPVPSVPTVSPPMSAMPNAVLIEREACGETPSPSRRRHPRAAQGQARRSVASAPMAARSERFTRSSRRARIAGLLALPG